MKDIVNSQYISQILEKPYENRIISQQKTIIAIIQSTIPNCSIEQAKKLSFFVEQFNTRQQLTSGSALLVREDKNCNNFQYLTYHLQPDIYEKISSKFCMIIKSQDITKCRVINTSIQQEVKYLQSNQYLQQIPRKRCYSLIKQIQPILLTYGQQVFPHLDSKLLDRNIYFARKGEFCYQIQDEAPQKYIEILNFKEGHLFNQVNQFNFRFYQGQYVQSLDQQTHRRRLNIRCKSSKGLLYKISKQYFASHLIKYCEQKLKQDTQKLNNLLQQRVQNVKKHRKQNNKLLTQKSYRSASNKIQSLIASKVSTSRKFVVINEPTPVVDIGQKSEDYKTLKEEQFPRNRLYSKGQLIKLSINPQRNQSDILLWKKSKCLKLKELAKPNNAPLLKSQTMLQFIKSTIIFEKNRKKPIIF